MTDVAIIAQPQSQVAILAQPVGIQGPPGPPGTSGGAATTYLAAGAVSGHVVVGLNAGGEALPASCDNLSFLLNVVGITLNAAADGSELTVQARDVIQFNGWTWTPGTLIYLGLNGQLVDTVPVNALFTQVVGKAVSASQILISIQQPIKG